jgi:hypothetical protein
MMQQNRLDEANSSRRCKNTNQMIFLKRFKTFFYVFFRSRKRLVVSVYVSRKTGRFYIVICLNG